jgi:hypothetical protein
MSDRISFHRTKSGTLRKRLALLMESPEGREWGSSR